MPSPLDPSSGVQQLDDWLRWLETLHPSEIELGLDRIRQVAESLSLFSQLEQSNTQIITIAGTNGKGTCVAALQALLLAAGKTVGAYTSPHLMRYNERIAINGEEASDQDIVTIFQQIETARGDVSLSYFEYGTLAAVLLFLRAKLDYWVLEVGLGGRLDAVNLLDPYIAIVTSIDLDHQDWLGNTREQIAVEKAGIYRTNTAAICAELHPPQTLLDHAESIQADLLLAKRNFSWQIREKNWRWTGLTRDKQPVVIDSIPRNSLPVASLSAALQAIHLLEIELTESDIKSVMQYLTLPGRCQQVVVKGRQFIFDVAHNPAAARHLSMFLKNNALGPRQKTLAIFAVMADKEIEAMVQALAPDISQWYLANLTDIPRAQSIENMEPLFKTHSIKPESCSSVTEAMTTALANSEVGDRILIFGSFYTVAEGLQWLKSGSTTK